MRNKLVDGVVAGIQAKKGRDITIVDLTSIEDAVCQYFVICQANSPNQMRALVDSIKEKAYEMADEKAFHVEGLNNSEWVAVDFGYVIVHLFLPETREFYQLESLWADAKLTKLKNID